MSISVYNTVAPTFIQILGALDGLIAKAQAHCEANKLPESALIEASLTPDMFNFAAQIHQAISHSSRALKLVQEGSYGPDLSPPPSDFAGLRTNIASAIDYIKTLDQNLINQLAGKPMKFEFGDYNMNFVADEFLLTFSQPNFFFHATTAYDILRVQGLALGKGDFMGAMRLAN